MRWRYRTILFEFHKDRVFGDKYIDDEEVEKTLNEQGAQGWELVNVTSIREGLLAFCKRPEHALETRVPERRKSPPLAEPVKIEPAKVPKEPIGVSIKHPRPVEGRTGPSSSWAREEVTPSRPKDVIGDIKIR